MTSTQPMARDEIHALFMGLCEEDRAIISQHGYTVPGVVKIHGAKAAILI